MQVAHSKDMFNSNRIKVTETPEKLKIETKPRKNWWYNISLLAFQVLMLIPNAGLILATINYTPQGELGGFIILGFALVLFVIYVWFWKALFWFWGGKEVVTITKETIKIQKKRGIGHPTKLYSSKYMVDFSIGAEPYCNIMYSRFFDTTLAINTGGRIKFDYGLKTIRFAYLTDNEDTEILLNLVKKRIQDQ